MLDQQFERLFLFYTAICLRSIDEDRSANRSVRRNVARVHLRELRALMPELNHEQFEELLNEATDFSARWDEFLSDIPS
jgi:hypothetical protein